MTADYQVLETLRVTGFGMRYRARGSDGEVVALEVPSADLVPFLDVDQLYKVVHDVAELDHPGIAAWREVVGHDGGVAVVGELVEGVDLEVVIQSGALPERVGIEIGVQLAAALEAANAVGLVHGDVRLTNLALSPTGNVKMLEFGLAAADTRSGVRASVADDVFAFGRVLFQLLTGNAPEPTTGNVGRDLTLLELHAARLRASLGADREDLLALFSESQHADRRQRPDWETVTRRLRACVARADGTSLAAWSQNAVPSLQGTKAQPSEGPLVGSLVSGRFLIPRADPTEETVIRGELSTEDLQQTEDATRRSNLDTWLIATGVVAFACVAVLLVAIAWRLAG